MVFFIIHSIPFLKPNMSNFINANLDLLLKKIYQNLIKVFEIRSERYCKKIKKDSCELPLLTGRSRFWWRDHLNSIMQTN